MSGEGTGHPTNTSPIKRRASQAEELLKAEDAGGMTMTKMLIQIIIIIIIINHNHNYNNYRKLV